MLINNLFFLLKSFDSDDWYECGKFVTSPYFVSGETNYRLFRAAKKYFTDKRRIKITNGSFETFFMNTGELKFVSKQTSHNRLSSFYKILKKFLQYKKVKPLDLYINMQGEYLSRNLLNGFADNLKTEEKNFKRKYLYSGESEFLHDLYSQKSEYYTRLNNNTESFRAHRDQMKFFAAGYLETLFYHNLRNYFSKFYEDTEYPNYGYFLLRNLNLEKVVKDISADRTGTFRRALIRYNLLKMYSENDGIKYLKELDSLFFSYENLFPLDFRLSVYNYIEAFYTNEINKGNTEYLQPLFSLLKQMDQNNLIMGNFRGIFSLNKFTNFVTVGLKVREFEIVEDFIERNSMKLPDSIRMDEYFLNMSRLYFQKKEYEKALRFLNKSNITYYDKYHFMMSRLKLQIYYELGMTEEAYSEMDNFKHRIRNSKITPREAKNFALDYIRIFQTLLKLKSEYNTGDTNHLMKDISENWNPMSRKWIAEKIQE